MNSIVPWNIINKALKQEVLSSDDSEILNNWIGQSEENEALWQELQLNYAVGQSDEFDRDLAFENTMGKVQSVEPPAPQARKFNMYVVGRVAAAILLLIGVFFVYQNLVVPKPAQLVVKTTAPGQRSAVTLADGSTVKLNVNSTLRYPERFEGEERIVELQGEAFFQIARDEAKPFKVKVGAITTQVLGTEFNIRVSQDNQVEVTVTSGRVQVFNESPDIANTVQLTKGQQVVASNTDGLWQVQEVETAPYVAWIDRNLVLDAIPFKDALSQIERAYGISIRLESDDLVGDCLIRGTYKNEPLELVLKGMQLLLGFDYKFEGDLLIISGGSCE